MHGVRVCRVVLVCGCLLAWGGSTIGARRAQDEAGANVRAETWRALGGVSALGAVGTLRITGKASRIVGPMRLDTGIELRLALPDRYVRIDRVAVGGRSAELASGFNGQRFIRRSPGGQTAAPSAPQTDAVAAAGARRDLALLLLGLFCGADRLVPMRFAFGGIAESPDGRADVLDVTGNEGLAARLFVDSTTRLPLLVSWMTSDVQAGLRGVTPGSDSSRGASPPVPPEPGRQVEHRLYFLDYRRTSGFTWPFRIRRSVAGQTTEELTFDTIDVNPALDPRAFEAAP
jgi:hypothetical protein